MKLQHCIIWRSLAIAPSLVAAVLLLAPFRTAEAGTVLYTQSLSLFGGYVSQDAISTATGHQFVPATAFDNFTLTADAAINEIQWTGEYDSGTPLISHFKLQIYADDSGAPGPAIFSTTVTNYNETLLGINALGDPYLSYDATGLFTGSLSAGTKYWLSIVATTGAAPPYWDWEAAAPGDGSFYYSSPAGAGLLPNGDFAFTLLGDTTAPEPGTLGILGLSLSFLGLIRRRTDNIQL